MMTAMELTGYRGTHADLLYGHWLPGELACPARPDGVPGLAAARSLAPTTAHPERRTLIAPGVGFVRFLEISWVSRHARVELGYAGGPDHELAGQLLLAAVEQGFRSFRLHRLYGWVTPAAGLPEEVLERAGFAREARVEEAGWWAGAPVERQIWGCLDVR
jgi:hypothetical protein